MSYPLNENIKRMRIAQGFNQVEFARRLGVTKQCVSNWENDNVLPSIEMLIKMADFFRVSTDYLLGRTEAAVLDVSALSEEQRGHIALLIEDLSILNRDLFKNKPD